MEIWLAVRLFFTSDSWNVLAICRQKVGRPAFPLILSQLVYFIASSIRRPYKRLPGLLGLLGLFFFCFLIFLQFFANFLRIFCEFFWYIKRFRCAQVGCCLNYLAMTQFGPLAMKCNWKRINRYQKKWTNAEKWTNRNVFLFKSFRPNWYRLIIDWFCFKTVQNRLIWKWRRCGNWLLQVAIEVWTRRSYGR